MCQVTAGTRAVGLAWDPKKVHLVPGPVRQQMRTGPEGVTPHFFLLLSSLYLRSRFSSLQDHGGEFWSSSLH